MMISFHGKEEIKNHFVANAIWHREMDKYVQGMGRYEDQKGCMIACSFKKYDHSLAPIEAGVPEWLARVADKIFEGLPKEESDLWTERFWKAIPVGADLEKVKAPFLIFVMETALEQFDHEKFPDVKKAIDTVIGLYKAGETDLEKFRDAARTAAYAARTAAYAARTAAYAARTARTAAYAARTAAYAADAAADAAAYAAYAAADVAAYAAYAAADVAAYAAAYAAYAAYRKFADKLIELMMEAT